MKKKAQAPTEADRINAVCDSLKSYVDALRRKHGLIALVALGSIPNDADGSQWMMVGSGDGASKELMLAWALGKSQVQRQQHTANLLREVVIDHSDFGQKR